MVAEGGKIENPLGGVSRLRFPPGPHLRSSRFSRHPRLRQAPTKKFAKNRNLRGCGEKAPGPWRAGPQALGARAPSPLETWPTGPWGLDPAEFLWAAQSPFWRPGKQARALHPGSLTPREFQKCPGAHQLMKSLACCTD